MKNSPLWHVFNKATSIIAFVVTKAESERCRLPLKKGEPQEVTTSQAVAWRKKQNKEHTEVFFISVDNTILQLCCAP